MLPDPPSGRHAGLLRAPSHDPLDVPSAGALLTSGSLRGGLLPGAPETDIGRSAEDDDEVRRAVSAARARRVRREVRLALARHRRLLAAGCAAGAVAAGLHTLAPDPAPTVPVLAAARDLAAGAVLGDGDVRVVRLPGEAVPSGALVPGSTAGRRLAGPVRAGEPLTDARVVGPSLLDGLPSGTRALALPVGASGAALVRVGDVVDVLVADGGGDAFGQPVPARARVVGAGVRVLAVLTSGDAAGGLLGGGTSASTLDLLVAADPRTTEDLAGAAAAGSLAVALRSP